MINLKVLGFCLSPDLLTPKYRKMAAKQGVVFGKPQVFGHCYVAAEAAFHLLGGKSSGFTPHTARDSGGDTHWWLHNKETWEILDPTAGQYSKRELQVLYRKGRACGFLTVKPSKRAQTLMARYTYCMSCLD
jgi:hypothetical protein